VGGAGFGRLGSRARRRAIGKGRSYGAQGGIHRHGRNHCLDRQGSPSTSSTTAPTTPWCMPRTSSRRSRACARSPTSWWSSSATFRAPAISFPEWKQLAALRHRLVGETPDLGGIVIGHGNRVSGRERVFPQPHAQGAGGDRGLAAPAERPGKRRGDEPGGRGPGRGQPRLGGAGVFVVLNDKIQAAREATKTSTFRLQTFRTPDFGVLGGVDGEHVRYYRRTERRNAPDTEFDIAPLDSLPRVDISYSYAGADGTAIRAFTSVGAKGIVLAAFAPGMVTPGEQEAIKAAVEAGVTVRGVDARRKRRRARQCQAAPGGRAERPTISIPRRRDCCSPSP